MTRTTSPDETPLAARVKFWPDLTYHYGLSIHELAVMPRNIIDKYIEALPRLIGEAQLRAIQAASFPHLDEGVQTEINKNLAAATGRAKAHVPRDHDEMAMLAVGVGLGVVTEHA